MPSHPRSTGRATLLAAALAGLSGAPAAADLLVTTTADQLDGGCATLTVAAAGPELSLREAICIANAEAGGETIVLAAASYVLGLGDAFESGNAEGDLDVHDDLRIEGAGRTATSVDAAGIDRVLEVHAGTVELLDLTLTGGQLPPVPAFGGSGEAGGGIRNVGDLTLTRVGVTGNGAGHGSGSADPGARGGDGGGIFNAGSLVLVDAVVTGNRAGDAADGDSGGGLGGDGGGIANTGSLSLTGTLVAGNEAGAGSDGLIAGGVGGAGGGLANEGLAILDTTLFTGNVAGLGGPPGGLFGGARGGHGGAIANFGELHVLAVTMADNEAGAANPEGGSGGDGGAVYDNGTLARYANCTISGNRGGDGVAAGVETGEGGSGGGLFVDDPAATVNNCTIAGNASGASAGGPPAPGGGIDSANAVLSNTILAGNQPGDCAGPPISAGWNLESGTDCAFTALGDQQNADPALLPLAANGGPVPTHALGAGSQALEAGNPAAPTGVPPACEPEDARAVARPQGPGCDIGAYEAVAGASVSEIPTLSELAMAIFALLVAGLAVRHLRSTAAAA